MAVSTTLLPGLGCTTEGPNRIQSGPATCVLLTPQPFSEGVWTLSFTVKDWHLWIVGLIPEDQISETLYLQRTCTNGLKSSGTSAIPPEADLHNHRVDVTLDFPRRSLTFVINIEVPVTIVQTLSTPTPLRIGICLYSPSSVEIHPPLSFSTPSSSSESRACPLGFVPTAACVLSGPLSFQSPASAFITCMCEPMISAAEIYTISFKVSGHSSWIVGLVPESSVREEYYIQSTARNGWRSKGTLGHPPELDMHDKALRIRIDAGRMEMSVSVEGVASPIVQHISTALPCRLGICLYNTTEVQTISADIDSGFDPRNLYRS